MLVSNTAQYKHVPGSVVLSSCLCCLQLTNTIIDIVQQAANYKQLRKGANEGKPMQHCLQHRAVQASWD